MVKLIPYAFMLKNLEKNITVEVKAIMLARYDNDNKQVPQVKVGHFTFSQVGITSIYFNISISEILTKRPLISGLGTVNSKQNCENFIFANRNAN